MSQETGHSHDSPSLLDEGCIGGLSSDSFRLRQRTGEEVHASLGNERVKEVIDSLTDNQQALYGWIEYCLRSGIHIEESTIEGLMREHLKEFQSRKEIHDLSRGKRKQQVELDLEQIQQRLQTLYRLFSRDEKYKRLAVLSGAHIHFHIIDDPKVVIEILEGNPLILGTHLELLELLARSYEKEGNLEMSLDVFQDLQCHDGGVGYLGKQVEILFRLGKTKEALELYAFAEGKEDAKKATLMPIAFYRKTIESDDDLRGLLKILTPVYMGEQFNEKTLELLRSAEDYIEKKLKRIRSIFLRIRKTNRPQRAPRFEGLHLEFLYLLEVSACLLLLVPGKNPKQMRGMHRYLKILEDHYEDYKLDTLNSILHQYFSIHSHEWLDTIRTMQGEEIEEPHDESDDQVKVSHTAIGALGEEDLVPTRLLDILEFLLVRSDGVTLQHQSIQNTLIGFHNIITHDFPDVEPLDDGGFSGAGEKVYYRLRHLDQTQRKHYDKLSNYVIKKYGTTIWQMLQIVSLETENFAELPLTAIRKDPKLLLFSLASTLIGDTFPHREKLASLTLEPILEALNPDESYFLVTLLFREGYYDILAEFLLDDAYLLGIPKFLELFLLAISYLDDVGKALYFLEELAENTLPDRYGVDEVPKFLEIMTNETKKESTERGQVAHAEFLYKKVTEDDLEIEAFSLDPIHADTKLEATQASFFFSIFRSLPPVTTTIERQQRRVYLESLYPFLLHEKCEAIFTIFRLSIGDTDRATIEKWIAVAENEEISIGLWKFLPFLHGSASEFESALGALCEHPFIREIPQDFHYIIGRRMKTDRKAFSMKTSFQASFVLTFGSSSASETFESARIHFEFLRVFLPSILKQDAKGNLSERYQILIDFLRPSGASLNDRDVSNFSSVESFYQRMLDILVEHMERLRNQMLYSLTTDPHFIYAQGSDKEECMHLWEQVFEPFKKMLSEFPYQTQRIMLLLKELGNDTKRILEGEDLMSLDQIEKEESRIYFDESKIVF